MAPKGYLAASFTVNVELSLNVTTEVRLEKLFGKSRVAAISFRCMVFELETLEQVSSRAPLIIKQEKASFKIQLTDKTECQSIAHAVKQKKPIEDVIKAQVHTCSESLVSVVVIQTDVGGVYILMVDLFKKQTVIDLTKRMHGDIPKLHKMSAADGSTTCSRVLDVQWVTLFTQKVALITLQDCRVVCFDQDG